MRKKIIFVELLFVFFYLVLPPMLKSAASAAPLALRFRAETLFSLVVALALIAQYFASPRPSARPLPQQLLAFALTVAALFASAVALVALSSLFASAAARSFQPPAALTEWLAVAAGIFSAALYEEAVYRVFLPSALDALLTPDEASRKLSRALVEISAVLCFALGHRYLGAAAVVNAVFGGTILRACFLFTRNPLQCALSHAAYNLLAVALSSAFVKIS